MDIHLIFSLYDKFYLLLIDLKYDSLLIIFISFMVFIWGIRRSFFFPCMSILNKSVGNTYFLIGLSKESNAEMCKDNIHDIKYKWEIYFFSNILNYISWSCAFDFTGEEQYNFSRNWKCRTPTMFTILIIHESITRVVLKSWFSTRITKLNYYS